MIDRPPFDCPCGVVLPIVMKSLARKGFYREPNRELPDSPLVRCRLINGIKLWGQLLVRTANLRRRSVLIAMRSDSVLCWCFHTLAAVLPIGALSRPACIFLEAVCNLSQRMLFFKGAAAAPSDSPGGAQVSWLGGIRRPDAQMCGFSHEPFL